MKTIVITASVRAVKAWRVPRRALMQASPGIEPGPAWQGGGVSCCATQHNGLLHVAAPVAALKLRLVEPLHATPVMSCAPGPARVARGSLRVAASHTPNSHWCVWSRPGPSPQGF
jgi:hypothetical protein